MKKLFQIVMAMATTLCMGTAAFGAAGDEAGQSAEVRFGIQLTRALNNDPKAQYLVAEMYEQGVGTPRNMRMAELWYTKSAKQLYAPAVEKLKKWDKVKQQAESAARERAAAEEQKRRQAEAEAEAAAAAKAREEAAAKAARERAAAEEQKRRQAEAAAAKAREEAAAKAARERAAAEEQKRRQAEAAAAKAREEAAAKAAHEEALKTSKVADTPAVAKDAQPVQPREAAAKTEDKAPEEFRANPCKTPTAKFTSVCQ